MSRLLMKPQPQNVFFFLFQENASHFLPLLANLNDLEHLGIQLIGIDESEKNHLKYVLLQECVSCVKKRENQLVGGRQITQFKRYELAGKYFACGSLTLPPPPQVHNYKKRSLSKECKSALMSLSRRSCNHPAKLAFKAYKIGYFIITEADFQSRFVRTSPSGLLANT